MVSHDAPQSDETSQGIVETPVGAITVTSDGRSIVRVAWREALPANTAVAGAVTGAAHDPLVAEALHQLRAYFDGNLHRFDLPLDLGEMSDVARAVLTTLEATVASGITVTYGELAARSGTGIPARAIGSIMGMNPLPVVIPCHRVVASDGLGGYSGGAPGKGLETKRWLLEHEEALPLSLF